MKKILLSGIIASIFIGIACIKNVSMASEEVSAESFEELTIENYNIDKLNCHSDDHSNDIVYYTLPYNETIDTSDGSYWTTFGSMSFTNGTDYTYYYDYAATTSSETYYTIRETDYHFDAINHVYSVGVEYTDFQLSSYDLPNGYAQPYQLEEVHFIFDENIYSENTYNYTYTVSGAISYPVITSDDKVEYRRRSFNFEEVVTESIGQSFSMSEVYDYLVENNFPQGSKGYHVENLNVSIDFGDDLVYIENFTLSIEHVYSNLFVDSMPSPVQISGADVVYQGYDLMPNIEYDYTSWLVSGVGGFMAFEVVPGFSIGGIFSVIIMIALLSYILKMFLGG